MRFHPGEERYGRAAIAIVGAWSGRRCCPTKFGAECLCTWPLRSLQRVIVPGVATTLGTESAAMRSLLAGESAATAEHSPDFVCRSLASPRREHRRHRCSGGSFVVMTSLGMMPAPRRHLRREQDVSTGSRQEAVNAACVHAVEEDCAERARRAVASSYLGHREAPPV